MVGRLLTSQQTAERLGMSVSGLKAWRLQGVGPKAIKMGPRLVRYDECDVDEWLARQRDDADRGNAATHGGDR